MPLLTTVAHTQGDACITVGRATTTEGHKLHLVDVEHGGVELQRGLLDRSGGDAEVGQSDADDMRTPLVEQCGRLGALLALLLLGLGWGGGKERLPWVKDAACPISTG